MKRKSTAKNKCSRIKCQGVLRETMPVSPQVLKCKVQQLVVKTLLI